MNKVIIKQSENKIKALLSDIIFRELDEEISQKVFITDVVLSGDKQIAKIYVDFFSVENKEYELKKIKKKSTFLRKELSKNLDTRKVPFLEFHLDKLLEQINDMENLIKKANK